MFPVIAGHAGIPGVPGPIIVPTADAVSAQVRKNGVRDNLRYADTSEPFGAFFLIEAADVDEAVKIASLHPGAHLGAMFGGGIEVRPVDDHDQVKE
jgi:hypothetical protein